METNIRLWMYTLNGTVWYPFCLVWSNIGCFIFVFHQDCNAPSTSQSLDRQPSDWLQSFKIPDRDTFSGSVQRAIDTGVISSKARREIVQVLRTLISIHTLYPVSEQYVTVSQKLVAKFPNLRDPIGTNGFVSIISDSICFHTCNFV